MNKISIFLLSCIAFSIVGCGGGTNTIKQDTVEEKLLQADSKTKTNVETQMAKELETNDNANVETQMTKELETNDNANVETQMAKELETNDDANVETQMAKELENR